MKVIRNIQYWPDIIDFRNHSFSMFDVKRVFLFYVLYYSLNIQTETSTYRTIFHVYKPHLKTLQGINICQETGNKPTYFTVI